MQWIADYRCFEILRAVDLYVVDKGAEQGDKLLLKYPFWRIPFRGSLHVWVSLSCYHDILVSIVSAYPFMHVFFTLSTHCMC